MNKLPWKYIFLTLFVLYHIFNFPSIPLLKSYVTMAIGLLLLILLLRRDIFTLLLLLFLLIIFKSFGMLPLPGLPDILPYRLVWMLIMGMFLFELIFKKRERILPFTNVEIAMVLFSVLCLYSIGISGLIYIESQDFKFNLFLNAYVLPFSLFFISKNVIDDEDKIKKLYILLSCIGLYLGLTGIFEYFKINELIFPSYIMYPSKGVHFGRSRGPFLNAAVNGTTIGIIIFTSIQLLLYEKIKWKRFIYMFSIVCMLVTLILTFTRGCWLAFVVGISVASIFIQQVRKVYFISLVALVVFVSVMFLFGQITYREDISERQLRREKASFIERLVSRTMNITTVTGRFDLYKFNLGMFFDKPIFGHGFGAYQASKKEFLSKDDYLSVSEDIFIEKRAGSHDTLTGILIDIGLTGFSLLMFILLYMIYACKKLYEKLPQKTFLNKNLAILSVGMFLVFLVKMQSSEMRYFLFPNVLFFSLSGMIVGFMQRSSQGEKEHLSDDVL